MCKTSLQDKYTTQFGTTVLEGRVGAGMNSQGWNYQDCGKQQGRRAGVDGYPVAMAF